MRVNVPLIAYFEGMCINGDTLYNYISSVDLQITGIRVQSRDGQVMTVNFLKNGTLFDVVDISGLDSGMQQIPLMSFAAGDNLTIQVATAPGAPLEGLTFTFQANVSDSVDNSALTNSKRIQTPLVVRYEGELTAGDTILNFSPTQRIGINGFTVSLRNPANAQVTLNVAVNGVNVTQIILPASTLLATGLISVYANSGDAIAIQILACGVSPAFGESLLLLLDYQNVTQEVFSSYQTPFIVEFEGIAAASNSILTYVWPRAVSLAAVQLFLRDAISDLLVVSILKNGVSLTALSITPGNTQTQPSPLNLNFNQGDTIQIVCTQPTVIGEGLVVTLDYFISVSGNPGAYTYYSSPASEIVLLCRQLGIGAKLTDAVSFANLEKYQADADNILNGKLRALYRCPLQKISFLSSNPYPGSVQFISQRLVLKMLLTDIYSEVEPNVSGNVDRQNQMAMEELNLILMRGTILEGQKMRSYNAGSNPYTAPLAEPNPPSSTPGFPPS
jgi:hypothetical protein